MLRRIVVLATTATLIALLTPRALAQETVVVETRDNVFVPADITIKAGDSIEFRNTGLAPHTGQDKAGSFNSGNLTSGQSATIRFDNEGTFQLICIYHETVGMTGRIVVSPGAGASAASATPSPTPSPTEAAAPAQAEFDPDAGVPLGMKVFPLLAGAMLLLLILAIGLGYIRNVQKTTETQ